MLGMLSVAANAHRLSLLPDASSVPGASAPPGAGLSLCSMSCCRRQRNGFRLIGSTYRLAPFTRSNPPDRRRAGPQRVLFRHSVCRGCVIGATP